MKSTREFKTLTVARSWRGSFSYAYSKSCGQAFSSLITVKLFTVISLICSTALAESLDLETTREVSRIVDDQVGNRWDKETKLTALLGKDLADNDKSIVYFALARNIIGPGFDSSVPREPQIVKVITYAEKALLYPQSLLDKCQLYGYLYNALRAKHSTNLVDNRHLVVLPLLNALNTISTNLLISEKQPRITGFVYDGDDGTNSPIYQTKVSEMNALTDRQNQIIFQNILLDYKVKYCKWVVDLYSIPPDAISELDKLAKDIIVDNTLIDKLLNDTRYALEQFVPKMKRNTSKPASRRDIPPSTD